ncbi:MAG: ABC transporter substrate-binding protein, partial [Mogibacterium sp.]|nr:ABC transporter substrate-binding protein [Mogibacterium sp.]
EELPEVAVIRKPPGGIYLAASSAMDLFRAIDGHDAVTMTSTRAEDWGIPEIRELVQEDRIHYVGKYRAPDYEALLEAETGLAIESTMIYHSPLVKEALEELGIPVLVERSSYETDPMGRLEWIRLYGLLLGREEAADAFFDEACYKIRSIDAETAGEPPQVAFFSVNSSDSVVARKPGDYITKMIEMAGGTYVLDDLVPEEENALSTMNLQMEAFYDRAVDAEILIYNSTIEGDLQTIPDLLEKSDLFRDFKAVRSGNVWCTNRNVYQQTTGTAEMIREMNAIFTGTADETQIVYFHRLES